jgi:hypothetical protein
MRERKRFVTLALALIVGLAGCKRSAPSEESTVGLDPAAAQRMRSMSDLLAATKTFSFKTTEDQHKIRANGEPVDLHYTRESVVQRPDHLWFDRVRNGNHLFGWYDGQTLTIRADSLKIWAQIDMPPTLDGGMDYIATTYRFPMPMADLLYSDPYSAFIGDSTKGRVVGDEQIGAMKCQHLAFTDKVVDFDVWVQDGQQALPCRLRIVYKSLTGEPHADITFSDWNLSPQVAADQFTASLPPDYRQIPVVGVKPDSTDGSADSSTDTTTQAPAPADSSP